MASSLTADSFYNLSTQHQKSNYNKELIYVKLTDAALRAIEEYIKNQNKYGSTNPSIQFLGNEGFLSFPSISNNGNSQMEQKFSFQLSDMEETQGSFECLQQVNGSMNVLGPIQNKMRVKAQEDVYESTRRSMAEAAQNQKKLCTREIKPNQQDIGRKITRKTTPIIPSNYNSRTTSNNATPNTNNSSSSINSINSLKRSLDVADRNNSSTNDGCNTMLHFTSQIPAINNSLSSYNSQDHHHDSYHHQSNHHHNNAINGVVGDDVERIPSGMVHNLNRNSGQQNHRMPDIARKPIKERLIHLLALRPFKKPELYDRLNREGIRERDRNVIANVLKSISFVRDNAYVLHRHIWNDVHEDWPFYSEQDRATLKRRKPQNLTPPLSSDGGSSSTSGQSPNSQHNGSPPPIVKRPSQSASSLSNNMSSKMNYDNDKYMEPVAKKQRISHYTSRDGSSYIHSRSRDNEDYYGSSINPNSHDESNITLNFTVLNDPSMISKRMAVTNNNRGLSKRSNSSNVDRSQRNRANGTIKTTTSSSSYDTIRTDNSDINIDSFRETSSKEVTTKANFSDYPPITSVEQRRKYKTEFDKDYIEYLQLHKVMEKARTKFANLQEQLRRVSSDERKRQEIQNKIIQEYNENNNSFQDKKQRFDYLHEKLSHIRKLVGDFDSQLTKGNVTTDNGLAYCSQQNANNNTQSIHTAY